MRIIIETENYEAAATSVQPRMTAIGTSQAPAAPSGLAKPSMMSEPLFVAGVETTDAGPAPSAIEGSTLTTMPAALAGSTDMTMTAGIVGAVDAGPAPTSVSTLEGPMASGSLSGGKAPTSEFQSGAVDMARVTVADTPSSE
jgi:hypothetical protein